MSSTTVKTLSLIIHKFCLRRYHHGDGASKSLDPSPNHNFVHVREYPSLKIIHTGRAYCCRYFFSRMNITIESLHNGQTANSEILYVLASPGAAHRMYHITYGVDVNIRLSMMSAPPTLTGCKRNEIFMTKGIDRVMLVRFLCSATLAPELCASTVLSHGGTASLCMQIYYYIHTEHKRGCPAVGGSLTST